MSEAPWFIASRREWDGSEVLLSPEESHHAIKVLRVAPPDVVTVTDGNGTVARCSAREVRDGRLALEILEADTWRPPVPETVVYQGAARGQKLDEVVDKLAQLGVAETCVYRSTRSVVRWDEARERRLSERWDSIARSAAKQSRNPFVMRTRGVLDWGALVELVAREPLAMALWEEADLPMRAAVIQEATRVALIVGPEGGLGGAEAEQLAGAGAQLVSLGPRIMRTENAPVVAVAGLLWQYGVIG